LKGVVADLPKEGPFNRIAFLGPIDVCKGFKDKYYRLEVLVRGNEYFL
jgi:hypothetical protein